MKKILAILLLCVSAFAILVSCDGPKYEQKYYNATIYYDGTRSFPLTAQDEKVEFVIATDSGKYYASNVYFEDGVYKFSVYYAGDVANSYGCDICFHYEGPAAGLYYNTVTKVLNHISSGAPDKTSTLSKTFRCYIPAGFSEDTPCIRISDGNTQTIWYQTIPQD